MRDPEGKRMGRSKLWMVALFTVLVAMTVGFGRLEHERRRAARPVDELWDCNDAGDPDAPSAALPPPDPVSEFLTELVSPDAEDANTVRTEGAPPGSLPLIGELPPLPEAYWPAPRGPFSQAGSPPSRAATY
jgi:hypothetical protein